MEEALKRLPEALAECEGFTAEEAARRVAALKEVWQAIQAANAAKATDEVSEPPTKAVETGDSRIAAASCTAPLSDDPEGWGE
ncbi:MAG: hypothetical protein HYV34_02050 [Candidatus Kerfeldbacteria bacterium]|nr:hypothetical protein [Candidatus Kerfeldbacteria bacterium]